MGVLCLTIKEGKRRVFYNKSLSCTDTVDRMTDVFIFVLKVGCDPLLLLFFSDLSTYTNIIATISPQIESVKKIFGVLSVSDDVGVM